jgi:hypothetical protein
MGKILVDSKQKIRASSLYNAYLQTLTWGTVLKRIESNDLLQFVRITNTHIDWNTNTVEWTYPLSLSARENSEDNPTWEEAINGPNRARY